MGQKEYLEDYKYTGITGAVYTPYVQNGKWYVMPDQAVSFLHFIYLCAIPEDEALVLKLKYTTKGQV